MRFCVKKSRIKNLLIIDNSLKEKHIFYNSKNLSTISIYYINNYQIINLLNKYNIKKIGIITHGTIEPNKLFINNFTDLIKNINIKQIDFISCNLLLYNEWIIYLKQFNNIIFGLSKNKVGNPIYGGSWYLDSINKDIKNIYFTNKINNLTEVLTNQIEQNGTIIQISTNNTNNTNIQISSSDLNNIYALEIKIGRAHV